MQSLADAIPSSRTHQQRESYTADQWKCYDFLRQHTARIEIAVDIEIQRIYFPIRPECNYISEQKKSSLMGSVDRESQQTKVNDLMKSVPDLIDEMNHNEALQNATVKITPVILMKLKDFSTQVGGFISLT